MNVEEALELLRMLTRDESSLSLLMDIYLCKIRIGMLIKNKKLIEENFEAAIDVCERGCDWDRRNKFKIYQAIYYLHKGDFKKTADFFSDSLPSFEKNEVVSYKDAVEYLIFSGMFAYDRNDINKKLYTSPEVLEICNVESINLITNFYECNYYDFLPSLYIYIKKLEDDLYLKCFLNLFCKEMKIKIYKQLLKSYQMLSLKNMANVFGISEDYLEDDLGNFISKKRLNCKIDKVSNIVVLNDDENNDMNNFVEFGENLVREISKKIN
ncbi:proteasome (macropain) 26s non- 6 [Vairimorpha apis BRL 01]|uniref:Proteasome ( macropain) 26s non-6 n=1 Tax=Vairimorpha apis BRL 01 TaxID=1037528 RepID=T0LBS7_9MICR|nr:proteasome (macropain) 26s non- 6 [Vairimorpha apis BRL 01]